MTQNTALQTQALQFQVYDRLRKAREITGLDKETFAAQIHVSRNTVGSYESPTYKSKRQPVVLAAWALRSGVPMEWILSGDLPPNPDDSDSMRRITDYKSIPLTRLVTNRPTSVAA